MKRRKLTIRIRRDTKAALASLGKEFLRVWKTGKSAGDILDFESPAVLFRVLTPKRWELIEQLQSLGPSSVRALARALDRDVKRVHSDVTQLIERGLVDRTEDGEVYVPYEVIHADFDLRAAA